MAGPYVFDQIFAADAEQPERVAKDGIILIYAVGDPSKTPLALTDASTGFIIQNPIRVNSYGFGPTIAHPTLDQVAWEGAGLKGTFQSYRGMKDAATAAAIAAGQSAQAAQDAAENAAEGAQEALAGALDDVEVARAAAIAAAGLVGAPAGAAVLAAIGPGGAAEGAFTAKIVSVNEAQIPPLVAESLAEDGTVVAAAAAAVGAALASSKQSFSLPWITTFTTGNGVVVRGTPTFTAGKFGNALTTGVLNCDNLFPEPVGYTQTIECWVKSSTIPSTKEAIIWGTQNSMWLSAQEGTGFARFTLAFTTGSRATSTVNICDGAWHHVAVSLTRESGTTILKGFWVDGVPTGATAPTNARTWPIDLIIGGHWTDATYDWSGQIDDLRVSVGQIYSGTFTPPTVANSRNGRTLIIAPLDSLSMTAGNEGYAARPSAALDGTVTYIGPVQPSDWHTDDRWVKTV